MNILEKIRNYAELFPGRIAVRSGEDSLTYEELWSASDRIASWLLANNPDPGEPIPVYGHKHPFMLAAFLGCVKAGCAYCPIDLSVPDGRVSAILHTLTSRLVLTTEELRADASGKQVLDLTFLQEIPADPSAPLPSPDNWVKGESTYYIIFTSGSTGTPKGVQISADCLNNYLDWSTGLSGCTDGEEAVYLNQAPFSFDLSVMDLYTCLATGGTLFCLKKSVQGDYTALIQALGESHAKVWVSTPSFADMCLSEKKYTEELLPELRTFLFCGEALGNRTVKKLQERFPLAKVYNTYGPTESTVAVTEVLVTPELNEAENPLPVGKAKPGTFLQIIDENGNVLPDNEKGEIIILGNTVSTGYYLSPALTEKAFFVTADGTRGYHTGDKGYLSDGMLYYCGRIDLQIKLHGYRIELEDIESNLRKLPQLEHAVVLPNERGGKVSSLTAYVVEKEKPEDEKAETAALKAQLAEFLPDYMIPKKFVFLDQMPMTNNGKADRKRLGELK
ncbi:MAG: D-alanine--poly(phosphoribitol) ligase subunit DltA [Clostridiales bacterium]|nr:D-alanine--poly(phosphoribitol) ligase subunit DltA [Candidatus Blautia equi]